MRAVRLSGGLDRCSGKVEIHRNGSWGTVCDNCWNKDLASTVCSMLGCGAGVEKFIQFEPPLYHKDEPQFFYSCSAHNQPLWECKERINHPFFCKDSKVSRVICNGKALRLVFVLVNNVSSMLEEGKTDKKVKSR